MFVCLEYILFVPPRGDSEAAALTVIRYSAFSVRFSTGDLRLSQNHILCIFFFIYSSFIKTNKLDNVDGESGINFEAAD